MELWIIWTIVALVFFIVEMFTAGIQVICFSVGALFAALGTIFTDNITVQVVIFAVGTVLAFFFLRPVLLKYFAGKANDNDKTNADALIGRVVKVVERIDNEARTGRVTIDGVTWRAVSDNDAQTYETGAQVEVIAIDSIILTIK